MIDGDMGDNTRLSERWKVFELCLSSPQPPQKKYCMFLQWFAQNQCKMWLSPWSYDV